MTEPTVETVVDRMHSEFQFLLDFLTSREEISLANTVNDTFRKSLLLCAASHFESSVGDCVVTFVEESSPSGNGLVGAFVRNKALSRQYHTWFSWNADNANQFFGLFGDRFRKFMADRIAADPNLRVAISAFMEIGRERNRLVHQDFGSFTLEKTAEEIYGLYKQAGSFIESLPQSLRQFK